MHFRNSILLASVILPACAGSGNLEPLQVLEDSSWSEYLSKTELVRQQKIEPRWWLSYQDDTLNQLIATALQDNLKLKVARSRIREARASFRVETSAMKPQVDADGSVMKQRLSETGSLPVGRIAGFEVEQTIYQAGFDAAWELDLFGRNPLRRKIANSRFQNELELQHDLHLSVAAEVARSYVQLRSAQAGLELLLLTIDRQQRIADAVGTLHEQGEVSVTEVSQAQALLAEYQARKPAREAMIRSLIYQLSVLCGQSPDTLSGSLATAGSMPTHFDNGLLEASSDLLRRRADVRQAERRYVIASSQHELAELAIYPTFSLFTRGGPNTVDKRSFFESESFALDFGGLVYWPLYNGGKLRAMAKIAEERTLQAEYLYSNAVLLALREVETIGTLLVEAVKEHKALAAADLVRRSIADNQQQRYAAGVSDLVTWLKTEQQSAESRQKAIAAHTRLLLHSIALHKALGGGWLVIDEMLE